MKRFFFAFLLAVLFAAPVFASGPWGYNNSVNPLNINGSYQGSIKGKNLLGTMRFTSSSSGQITVTSTNYVTIYSGSTPRLPIGVVTEVVTQVLSATGYANIFLQGNTAQASLDTAVDLKARSIAGLITGGVTGSQTLSNPSYDPSGSGTPTATTWTVANSMYFTGNFDGNFSKNWTANSFSAKGSLAVTQVDIADFYKNLVNSTTKATAAPSITQSNVSIKVSGVKTTDAVTAYTPASAFTWPTVTQN